jgi:hypothetical protein
MAQKGHKKRALEILENPSAGINRGDRIRTCDLVLPKRLELLQALSIPPIGKFSNPHCLPRLSWGECAIHLAQDPDISLMNGWGKQSPHEALRAKSRWNQEISPASKPKPTLISTRSRRITPAKALATPRTGSAGGDGQLVLSAVDSVASICPLGRPSIRAHRQREIALSLRTLLRTGP